MFCDCRCFSVYFVPAGVTRGVGGRGRAGRVITLRFISFVIFYCFYDHGGLFWVEGKRGV